MDSKQLKGKIQGKPFCVQTIRKFEIITVFEFAGSNCNMA